MYLYEMYSLIPLHLSLLFCTFYLFVHSICLACSRYLYSVFLLSFGQCMCIYIFTFIFTYIYIYFPLLFSTNLEIMYSVSTCLIVLLEFTTYLIYQHVIDIFVLLSNNKHTQNILIPFSQCIYGSNCRLSVMFLMLSFYSITILCNNIYLHLSIYFPLSVLYSLSCICISNCFSSA